MACIFYNMPYVFFELSNGSKNNAKIAFSWDARKVLFYV